MVRKRNSNYKSHNCNFYDGIIRWFIVTNSNVKNHLSATDFGLLKIPVY